MKSRDWPSIPPRDGSLKLNTWVLAGREYYVYRFLILFFFQMPLKRRGENLLDEKV